MKINELIKELCPNGVEWKTFGEVSEFRRGSFPQPYTNPSWYGGEDAAPFVQVADVKDDFFELKEQTKQTISIIAQPLSVFVPKGSVLITLQGTIGRVAITQYDAYVDRTIAIFTNFKREMSKKYFCYVAKQKFDIEKVTARGTTIKTITKEEFSQFQIPIPPLAIQTRIVEILDHFTNLTANLNTELNLRRKQFEHYREKLLAFGEDVENGVLLDMLKQPITDGPHETPKFVENGIPFISVEAVVNSRIDFANIRGYISEEYDEMCCKKYKPQRNDVYVVKSGSTVGKVAMVDFDKRFNIWSPLAALRVNDKNSARYLFYLLQSDDIQKQIQLKCSKGSQPNLSMRVLEKFDVFLPPLAIQTRIVEILDKFTALIANIEQEIALRQKQYEYYREQLLSFERETF